MAVQKIEIALDIGSSSIKGLAFGEDGRLIGRHRQAIMGQLPGSFHELMDSLASDYGEDGTAIVALTGSNAEGYSRLFNLRPVPDIMSCCQGAIQLYPGAGCILEIGAEQARFLRLRPAENGGTGVLGNFTINSLCSAGTGTFLAQEAHRLGLSVQELGQRALLSRGQVAVAGRCAVFAKTDLIHKQQNGVLLDDLAKALCRMVAQNACTELIGTKEFRRPLVFVGGVASNAGVQKALREILCLDDGSLIVPPDHSYAGAWGAYSLGKKEKDGTGLLLCEARQRLNKPSSHPAVPARFLPPLKGAARASRQVRRQPSHFSPISDGAFIGLDIGSTTTNLVCLNSAGDLLLEHSLPTKGQALPAVFQALGHLHRQWEDFSPRGVGITGSGRRLVAEIIGADVVVNEIMAHAEGGLFHYPDVETIFDIGGQDSKFISLQDGSVIAFEMNKVCSAGTGSFLEEISEMLGLDIRRDFAREALSSSNPIDLGERCTVFMGSEIMRKLQEGCSCADLTAGLSYSIARNYLARVVGRQKIGKRISFQGGVAGNEAVARALENLLQNQVPVHEHHEVAGALGAALLARKEVKAASKFRGFENLDLGSYKMSSFECHRCNNRCTVSYTVSRPGGRFFSGGICDRYDAKAVPDTKTPPNNFDLYSLREQAIGQRLNLVQNQNKERVLGIPSALLFHELKPFWAAFFNHLELPYEFSGPTTKKTLEKGAGLGSASACLPLKIAYGHCLELAENGIRKIFVPSISNLGFKTEPERLSHVCSVVQAWPFLAKSLFPETISFLCPTLRFAIPHVLTEDLVALGKCLGFRRQETLRAFAEATEAQKEFYRFLEEKGNSLLSGLDESQTPALILSRPYLVCDSQIQLRLQKILRNLNVVAIPLEMLPGRPQSCSELGGMYWYFGKRFLQASHRAREQEQMPVIQLSAFGCGADSFLIHFLRQELKGHPFLELEIDEHIDFTGLQTRLEAFFGSLKQRKAGEKTKRPLESAQKEKLFLDLKGKTLFIPQMSDHAFAFAAAFQSCGVKACVLPLPDEQSIFLGRQSMSGQECLPCAFVTGDMLRCLKNCEETNDRPSFFMISGDGPCRLGQYPYLMRQVLDENGYSEVPMFTASQDQTFYDQFGIVPAVFKRRAWQGTVAVDLLYRRWRECRPYVVDRALLDETYKSEVQKIADCLREGKDLAEQMERSFDNLEKISKHNIPLRPIIAVLGENYVRCNSVANGRIAEALEELGAEVWFPSLFEWIYYTNQTARLHCRYEKQRVNSVKLILTNAVQRWDAAAIARRVKHRLRNYHEPSMRRIFKLVRKYVPSTFEGETIIGIGRTIDFHNKGVSGVIHVAPFGCIAGSIVETLSERVSRDLGGFPIRTIRYDGKNDPLPAGELEAFMVHTQLWQRK